MQIFFSNRLYEEESVFAKKNFRLTQYFDSKTQITVEIHKILAWFSFV